jgi:glycosyltransferase involved in cell wall biosynthesis
MPLCLQTQAAAKPRVLIVPNAASWIIGQMAMHIIRKFRDRYEFWLLTDKIIRLRPDIVRALLPSVDFIFPLTDKGYHLLSDAVGPHLLPPSLLWLHHLTTWNSAIHQAVRESVELIACTESWKRELARQAPREMPITVVPHGVDPVALRRVPAQREKFNMPVGSFVIGFVGSKTSNYDEGRKGLDILHELLCAARLRIPNLHISFLGLGWETEVQSLRLAGISANYVGFIPESELASFYSSIDAYLLTSRVEGGPCTVLEAMACQTPVVATQVGLVPEVVKPFETGFSAPVSRPADLLEALCQLAADPTLRKKIGEAARAGIRHSRSWDFTLDSLEAPLARMAALSPRTRTNLSPATALQAECFTRAVHTIDGLLWGAVSWWQNLVDFPTAIRLIRSCWEGYSLRDIARGFGLAFGLRFRHSSIRKLLSPQPLAGGSFSAPPFPKQNPQRSGVSIS